MKQENTKKSKLWLWLVLGVVLLAVVGTVLAFVLGGGSGANAGGKADRADLYWNVDRELYMAESETGLTTRRPGEDGTYLVRFAYNGEIKEFVVADRKLVNEIDYQNVMGLEFDNDGVVIDVLDPEEVAVRVGKVNYVHSVNGNVVKVNSSIAMNGMSFNLEITDKTQIYDVREGAENPGQIIDVSYLKTFASVEVFSNEQEEVTHIYLTATEEDSELYWRAEQFWNSTTETTNRVPDGDGYYSIEFCCNGELVTLKTRSKTIAEDIDYKSRYSAHFCFAFDENGNIIEILSSAAGSYGIMMCQRANVRSIEGNVITAKADIIGDDGSAYTFTLPEDCAIYDASNPARRNGVQGHRVDSLQLGDCVTVWTDTEGVPVLVYIAQRIQDVPAFFSMERCYDATNKVSTREPNEKGWYELEMVKAGSIGKVTVKTKDKKMVDFIDSHSNRVVGLELDGNVIVQAYEWRDVYGGAYVRSVGSVVNSVNGVMASVMSYGKPEAAVSFILSGDCKIYDVSGIGKYGEETELRVGDIAYALTQASGETVVIFVVRRIVGADKLYYNLNYLYDSAKQESTRQPDENGYYVFNLIHQGKQVTVKTKDKEMVDQMDASGDLTLGLDVKNGIVRAYYDSSWTYGQKKNSGWRVRKLNDDGTIVIGNSLGKEETLTLSKDCKIWNVSEDYETRIGEKTKLRVGDMVVSYADIYNEVQEILVRRRYVDNLAWKTQRLYDATEKKTLRTPDADGWYCFEMAVNGKIRTLKTKDLELANRVEAQEGPMGLRLSGDVIKSVVPASWMRDTQAELWNGRDIIKIKNSEVTAEYTKPGYSLTGSVETRKLASNVKVYDFSATAKQFGEKTTLKVGDRVRTFVDREGNLLYVLVLNRATRTNGTVAYCSHCDKEVRWHPWSGARWDGIDCHYYLEADITLSTQTSVGNETINYEVVLDLDGKTLTMDGARAFMTWRGDTLTIIDSVGGGGVKGTGTLGGNGGLIFAIGGSTVNLLGGTYTFLPSDLGVARGAVAYVYQESVLNIDGAVLNGGNLVGGDFATGGAVAVNGSECNFYSGTINGGNLTAATPYTQGANQYTQGGSVHVTDGVFNMYGGVISGGVLNVAQGQAGQGGNIYALRSQVNILGGKVVNGTSGQHGGNIFASSTKLTLKDTTVSGGTVGTGVATGVYCQKDCTVEVLNSTVDGSVFMNSAGCELILDNATMTGDIQVDNAKSVVVSGATKVSMGETTGIYLGGDVLMDVSGLKSGAKLFVEKDDVFTTELSNPAAYTSYFESVKPFTSAQVKGNALAILGDRSQLNEIHEAAEQMTADGIFNAGGIVTADCPYCGESVQWEPMPAANGNTVLAEAKHYYLDSDLTSNTGYYEVNNNICLHLNGHNITSSARVMYVVKTVNIMGAGQVSGSWSAANRGVMDVVGAMNLFGGTYTAVNGNVIMARNTSAVNVYDGTTVRRDANAASGNAVSVMQSGSFNLFGGEVTGGDISVDETNTSASFHGGKVTNGSVIPQGTVANIEISGATEIEKLDLTSGTKLVLGELTGNAQIAVLANGVFTEELENPDAYLAYLSAVDVNYEIAVQGQTLAVVERPGLDRNTVHTLAEKMTTDGVFNAGGTVNAECPYCRQIVDWEPLPAATSRVTVSGTNHYYLASDMPSNAEIYYIKGNTCLHLNGHNITSTVRVAYAEGTLNIMGAGEVTGSASAANRGVMDVVGTLNLFGGTYTSANGNVIIARAYGVVNMYDGATVLRNANAADGHAVNVIGSGAFNLHGGEVADGNIHAEGADTSVGLHGGKLTNGSVMTQGAIASIQVSGAPEIELVELNSGNKLVLGELKPEAKIGVSANGAFTVTNDNAASYTNCFLPLGELYKVELKDNVFYCAPDCTADSKAPLVNGQSLKILAITSNQGRNTTDFLYEIAKAEGATNVTVARLYKANCTLESHWEYIDSGDGVYQYTKKSGSSWVQENDQPLMLGLLDEEWDIILIEQSAADAPVASTYQPYMDQIMEYLKDNAPDAKVVWNMGWAYETGSSESILANTFGGDQMAMYEGIVSAMSANVMVRNDIAALLPIGTAIQNMRTSYIGDTLTNDKVHLTDFAKILAGYTAYATLLDQELTEINLDGVNNVYLTSREKQVILESVNNALKNPLQVTESAYTGASFADVTGQAAQMTFTTGTVSAKCPFCGVDAQWEPLPAANGTVNLTQAKHYYLETDLNNTGCYDVKNNICLHLNGHNITSTTGAFLVNKPLVIMGSGNVSGKGTDKNQDPCDLGVLDVQERLYLFGGTYTSLDATPVVSISNTVTNNFVNMYDGVTITRNGAGTNVTIFDNGKLNMYGGTISGGNTTGNGGNIWVKASAYDPHKLAAVNIYGGTVENGTAAKGGNIYATGALSAINLVGGEVKGGSVYAEADVTNISLSGVLKVSYLDLSSGAKAILGELETGSEIVVNANGIFTVENALAGSYKDYFVAYDANSTIELLGSALVCQPDYNGIYAKAVQMTTDGVFNGGGTVTAKCPYCGVDAQWEPLPATSGRMNLDQKKHYYVATDLENGDFYYVKADTCLHLNGHNITSSKRVFYGDTAAALTVMGDGRVTGASDKDTHGAVDMASPINLFGGTYLASNGYNIVAARGTYGVINMYEGTTIIRENGGVVGPTAYIVENGAFNLYGGVVSGGYRGGNGGNFQIAGGTTTTQHPQLNVYGGTIEKGTVGSNKVGGNIYATGANASVSIYGGTIAEGSVYTRAAVAYIEVSGAARVDVIDLTEGTKLKLGDLSTGADIRVIAPDGVISTTHENAASYTAFIKAANAGKKITASNNALVMGNA